MSRTLSVPKPFQHTRVVKDPTQDQVLQIKRNLKYPIVFTNGVFDLLHPGHVQNLVDASELGASLVVGVNSDDSVKALKGSDRPIRSESDRAFIVASLAVVDYVIIFSEITPDNILFKLQPHIVAKGGDYFLEDVKVRGLKTDYKITPLHKDYSTTKEIEKICRKRKK